MTNHPDNSSINLQRLLIKAILLFLIFNLAFTILQPQSIIGQLSVYNWLLPGRLRLPYGDRPDRAYNLSLFNLEAMLASHEIAGDQKSSLEYRVILIGDSSVWGFLLRPEETLSEYLNQAGIKASEGKQVRVYNFGYPTMSLTKDLMFLRQAVNYQPDLIVWLITLESFPISKQLDSQIAQNNPDLVSRLTERNKLDLSLDDGQFVRPNLLERSIFGQRRQLADIVRLQLYGVLWAATGIDQYYPEEYDPPQSDLTAELKFHELVPPVLDPRDLALNVLEAGVSMSDEVPVLFVNEPIYISQGENSDIRYNFFYPKWAYDQYRTLMTDLSLSKGWNYLDLWDLVPQSEFTNSAIHFSPDGEMLLAREVGAAILKIANP